MCCASAVMRASVLCGSNAGFFSGTCPPELHIKRVDSGDECCARARAEAGEQRRLKCLRVKPCRGYETQSVVVRSLRQNRR